MKPSGRTTLVRRIAAALVVLPSLLTLGCADLQNAIQPPTIAKVAPEPVTPLALPTTTMKGGKGEAEATFPPDFAATVKSDGTILFPQHTQGRVQGASLLVGGEPVLTVADDGSVKGVALKHRYAFSDDGALLDPDGHGVRIAPDGSVRAVGGSWRYASVFAWTSEGGAAWDRHAWRTLELVALVVLENMMPSALRAADEAGASTSHGADKDKGHDIHIPPPSQWFK